MGKYGSDTPDLHVQNVPIELHIAVDNYAARNQINKREAVMQLLEKATGTKRDGSDADSSNVDDADLAVEESDDDDE